MAAGDLTTLANAKSWLGITGSTDDAMLTRLVSMASAWVVAHINRQILTASYTTTFNGNGGDTMLMPNTPITAVTAVTIDGVVIPAQTTVGTPGFTFDGNAVYLIGYTFTQFKANVVISYTAGYDTTPLDVEQATLELVEYRYTARSHPSQKSVGMAGQTTAFITDDIPAYVKAMLANYRRVAPL